MQITAPVIYANAPNRGRQPPRYPLYAIKSRLIGTNPYILRHSVLPVGGSIAQALRATTTLLDNLDLCPLAHARHFRAGRENLPLKVRDALLGDIGTDPRE